MMEMLKKEALRNLKDIISGELKKDVVKIVASTPKEIIFQENRSSLLRVKSDNEKTGQPLLIIPSMVNKYYILDLLPQNSVLEFLSKAGFDTFIIDWGSPSLGDEKLPFEWYVPDFIDKSFNKIKNLTGHEKVHLLGYCMGGTFALIYSALNPSIIKTIILMASPVDFSKGGTISVWSKFVNMDSFTCAYKNIPHKILHFAFGMINPAWQIKQFLTLIQFLHSREFLTGYTAVSQWTTDNVDVPNEVFKKYSEDCYQQNKLIKGEMVVSGKKIDLRNIKSPVLSLASRSDFLVPPESSTGLKNYLGSDDVSERIYETGHIGLSIGPLAMKKIWNETVEWIKKSDI